MTIKVEREALLCVLSRAPSGPSSPCIGPTISDDGEFVFVDIPKPLMGEDFYSKSLRGSTSEDDQSLCTLSTDSLSTDSADSHEKRVTFAAPLVTEEWSRPWTPREEVSKLFYSTEETQRFRHEYRLERKVLSELSIDPDTFPVEDSGMSNLIATSTTHPSNRHLISRVVVLHNDKLETFVNPGVTAKSHVPSSEGDFFDNDSFWSGSLTWY